MNNDYNNGNNQNDYNNGQYNQNGNNQYNQNGNGQYNQNGSFYGGQQTPPPINNFFWQDANEAEGLSKARSAKTLGIIGLIAALICCPLAGLILGILALNSAKTSRTLLNREEPDAKTARTLGILAIVFAALGFVANMLITVLQLLGYLMI